MIKIALLNKFVKQLSDAFKTGKVLASNPNNNHAAALFGSDDKKYLFKDSGPSLKICYLVKNSLP